MKRRTPPAPMLSRERAADIVRQWCDLFAVVPITSAVCRRALDAVFAHSMSFWDALIWAAAKEHGISMIYSEDGQHGREIEGVQYINPFLGLSDTAAVEQP